MEEELSLDSILAWLADGFAGSLVSLVEEIVFGIAQKIVDIFLGESPDLG